VDQFSGCVEPSTAEGRSNAPIAEQLVVTDRAVEKRVTSIFRLPAGGADHWGVLAVLRFLEA
jgi:hypothetical protein